MFCYFDIDNLKPINDNYGHNIGDQVIQRFAAHLTKAFDSTGIIARFGGDEFVVMLIDETNDEVDAKLNLLKVSVEQDGLSPQLCYSSGYVSESIASGDNKSLESLIGAADKKMYQNKPAR